MLLIAGNIQITQSQILDLTLTVYGDGVVRVKEVVQIGSSSVEARIQTFGQLVTEIVVRSEVGLIVNSSFVDGVITVKTSGSNRLTVTYLTGELTSKEGNRWRLAVSLPTYTVVNLPDGSTVVNLDPLPVGISNVGVTMTLLMPAGNATIEYYIGITGTREHALALLDDLEETIRSLRDQGYVTASVEGEYNQTVKAYQGGKYVEAETLAMRVKDELIRLKELADGASIEISSADKAIEEARSQGRISNLEAALQRLTDARSSFTSGLYEQAGAYAKQALYHAQSSTSISNPLLSWTPWIVSLTGLVVVCGYVFVLRKPRLEAPDSSQVDLELIRSEHPEIREDDLPSLTFIARHPGGVFMSQIRDGVSVPRSTAWRTVTRLEEMGVVESRKLGRETFIRINSKYRRDSTSSK